MKARLRFSVAVAAGGILALALTAADASARMFSRSFSGFYGARSASINRAPGSVSGTRSFQGYGGHGYTRNFSRSCSGGTCNGSATTTFNNGNTWSHNGSITNNGTTANWNRTVNGPQGGTVARTGSCASGAGCASTATATAANGTVYTAQRSTVPNGSGGYNYGTTFAGPSNAVTFPYYYPRW